MKTEINTHDTIGQDVSGSALSEGYCKDEICNRNNCKGIIDEYELDGGCSCHINPPCGYCTEPSGYCNTCGWDAKEEQYEIDEKLMENNKRNSDYYEKQRQKYTETSNLFDKKYRGEMPADKLEIRTKGHTHFSMKKIGVFPKGSETYKSLLPKVRGTFGGRFATFIDENSFRFEYIAYTD